jgi:hypothetical protein
MAGRRNSLGRFEKTELTQAEGGFTFPVPTGWSTKLIIVVVFIFLVSPWIFMMIKNNAMAGLSDKITGFYENYFSCNCPINTCSGKFETTLNKTEIKNGF